MQELGLIRKPSSFMSSICDERGAELLYAGMPITEVFKVSTFLIALVHKIHGLLQNHIGYHSMLVVPFLFI